MRFTKLHGLGNDYVYVDCFRQPPPRDPAALSRVISDRRHFGVGSDGLILSTPPNARPTPGCMFNADGSEAEMCGNGVRCVAKYVYDHGIAVKPHTSPSRPATASWRLISKSATARSIASPWTWGSRFWRPTRFRRRCRGRA